MVSNVNLQFETVRRLRTAYGNFLRSSSKAGHLNCSIVDQDGSYTRLSQDPCGSLWLHRFAEGMANRMGKVYLTHKLIMRFFHVIENRIRDAKDQKSKHDLIIISTYCAVSYVLPLRGDEGFLLDVKELRNNWLNHPDKYLVITLLGKLKGEKNDNVHKFPCSKITNSGLNIKNILLRALNLKAKMGYSDGLLISDMTGILIAPKVIDDLIHEVLVQIYHEKRTLFPICTNCADDIVSHYKSYRSFRRTSDTRALKMKVPSDDIDIVNRWRTNDIKHQGKRAAVKMRHHYSDFDKLIKPFLRYTAAM